MNIFEARKLQQKIASGTQEVQTIQFYDPAVPGYVVFAKVTPTNAIRFTLKSVEALYNMLADDISIGFAYYKDTHRIGVSCEQNLSEGLWLMYTIKVD